MSFKHCGRDWYLTCGECGHEPVVSEQTPDERRAQRIAKNVMLALVGTDVEKAMVDRLVREEIEHPTDCDCEECELVGPEGATPRAWRPGH